MILCRLCTTHGPEIGACQAVKVQATHSNAVPGPKKLLPNVRDSQENARFSAFRCDLLEFLLC